MIKRLLTYVILLVIYLFLPGIVQQIFMEYDDYYLYIIITFLLFVNVLLASNLFKSFNRLTNYIIAASIVTGIGILSCFVVANLNLGWDGIRIAIWSNAISSLLTWEIIFQFNRKKRVLTALWQDCKFCGK